MAKMKVEMTGYNDEKAVALYSVIKTFHPFIVSLIIACVCAVFAIIFKLPQLTLVFVLPGVLLLFMALSYVVNSNYKEFLKGLKTKHDFRLENGILYKDNKEVKSTDNIRLYKFNNFLFLELKKSYYRIPDDEYTTGSRTEFLAQVKKVNGFRIAFIKNAFKSEENSIET